MADIPDGKKLFSEVTELTGLPEDLIGEELRELLDRKGIAPEQMTMESLREALADYLTQMMFQMEEEEGSSEREISGCIIKAPTQ